ncbi:MAG TPA: hypothetical protein VGL09_21770 [Methylomirabilota bacterium]|jgi:hypothetical protein
MLTLVFPLRLPHTGTPAGSATANFSFTWSPMLVGIGIVAVVVVGLLVAWGVRALEAQRERDEEASRLQAAIAALIQANPRLQGLPIQPTVQIPRKGPATLTLTGQVRSTEAREALRRVLERSTAGLPRRFTVDDRTAIVPSARGAAG